MKAILTYHSIDDSRSPISVSEAVFNAHVRWFERGHVRVLSLTDLVAHSPEGADAVAVTFDDGFKNVAGPVERLLGTGLAPTIFVVTGHVGKTNAWGGRDAPGIPTLPLLDWSSLEHLVSRGAAVEAHTRTHRGLHNLPTDAMDAELQGCHDELRVRLGVPCTHVAYPYGHVSDTVVARASRIFRYGHTTDFRMMRVGEALMRLPRLDMYYFRRLGALEAWGSPAFKRRCASIRIRRMIRAWARI